MRKSLTAAVSALVIGGMAASVAVPAQAQYRYNDQYYDRRDDNDAGVAIAAGVIGLAIGAMLGSSSSNSRYNSYGYNSGYGYNNYGYNNYGYGSPYGYSNQRYGYGYNQPRICQSVEQRRDPYTGRIVSYRRSYYC